MPLPDAFFGPPEAGPLNWRAEEFEDEGVDDDEELNDTPEDVVELLGFDPKEA